MGEKQPNLQLLTIADVARVLACSEANVYAIIESGALPYLTIGKSKGYRVDRQDLAAFIESRKVGKQGVEEQPPGPRPRLRHLRI
jgi:excisionase family DNA binding protein